MESNNNKGRSHFNGRRSFDNDVDTSNVHQLYSDSPRDRAGHREQSWKGIVDNISTDMSRLWERESLLIRAEINEKFSDAKSAASSLAVGGALLFVGLIAAVMAAIYILDVFMPLWLAALIVTVALFAVGGVMVSMGKRKLEMDKLKPRHSIETLGEIKNTLQERANEFRH